MKITPSRALEASHQPKHTISERMLLFLSRPPGTDDYPEGIESWESRDPLSSLCRSFPGFMARIEGKRVLDFGCGLGYQVAAMARRGAAFVVGIESNLRRLERARELARESRLDNVELADCLDDRLKSTFDLVISQNSMEHYPEPLATLFQMKSALKPGGAILIVFCPPWFAPYGSHMHFFTKVPWVNLLFDEETVMNVRAHFRSDGARRYEEVESGLNKMTVAKFESLIARSGLKIEYRKYEGVKGLDFLGRVPAVRELFINRISSALRMQ